MRTRWWIGVAIIIFALLCGSSPLGNKVQNWMIVPASQLHPTAAELFERECNR